MGEARISVQAVGEERQPVVIIDDALAGAEQLIDAAAAAPWDVRSPYYPGPRALAPPDYVDALTRALAPMICDIFQWRGGVVATEASFSLVTTPPEALAPYQRVPHFDGVDPYAIAVLHYLKTESNSGTAFFRHRATGFESVTPERLAAYQKATDDEVRRSGPPPSAYVSTSTDQFERTAVFDSAFNRILVYRGCTLHSGLIPRGFAFSDDPRVGRLTANTFLRLVP